MNYNDLTDEQQEIWDAGYEEGHSIGWDSAVESTSDDDDDSGYNYEVGYNDGFLEGARAEQDRIQSVLQMMFESSLNMGHGNKAVQYKHAMDLLRPINYKYDEAKYYEDLRNDGF